MEVREFAFPIDPVENLIRGMGQGAYRGRRGEGGYSQSPFPKRIHFLLLIRLFCKIASDELEELDDVACMVNGAGLAMATVDIIKENGGEPANFLDVGGDSTPEKIVAAFRIMLEDDQVDGILINIFGGINKCDVIATGIVEAAALLSGGKEEFPIPVVVRLEGRNVERGREILAKADIKNLYPASSMDEGAKLAIRLAKETREKK